MKRKTKGIIIGIVILLIILSSFPNITSKPIINNENNYELPEGIIEVAVESMYIEGAGVHETSDVYAFAESDLKI